MIGSILNRLLPQCDDSFYSRYDTEINTHESRYNTLYQNFDNIKGRDLLEEGMVQITDSSVYNGNQYWKIVKDYLQEKTSDKKAKRYTTVFLDRDHKTPLTVIAPTFNFIDSMSKFITGDVEKMEDEFELGESKSKTYFMQQGLSKARMQQEMPRVAGRHFNLFLFTIHIGKEIIIPTGPMTAQPKKSLQHIPQGEILKGINADAFYLLNNLWYITGVRSLTNANTKAPEYPHTQGVEIEGDLDLNIVTMRQLRGKNGQSGFNVQIIVSQTEGVLASLTEFHFLKVNERYGFEGNDRNYSLALYPDVGLSRTTVRTKLREDAKLRRAVEITSQMLQIKIYHRDIAHYIIDPKDLRAKLIEKGYDMDFLLSETRSYHTLNDEEHPKYPLSTLDLCRIVSGEYHPYWLSEDCKTIKKEYRKKS
jgi:hypothetical protein